MNFYKKIRFSICCAVIISVIFSVISFAKTSDKIRNEVLRLHVIANSDSDFDQSLKLKVRDAVLKESPEIFDGSVNIENAIKKIKPELKTIKKNAEKIIEENGYDYNVRVTISREYFTTRTYETVTLPAGKYLALRIVIGEGEGHNWWCVMFPPMCLPAASKEKEIGSVLNENEVKLVCKNPKYEIRFKIVEIYEEMKNRISD